MHWIRIANKIFTMQSQFESASIRRIYRGLWDHFGIYSSRLWHITPLDSSTAQQVYQNIMYSWETNCVFFCRLFHTHRAKYKYNDAMQQSDVCMFSILITDEWQSRELPSVFLALVHIMIVFCCCCTWFCAHKLYVCCLICASDFNWKFSDHQVSFCIFTRTVRARIIEKTTWNLDVHVPRNKRWRKQAARAQNNQTNNKQATNIYYNGKYWWCVYVECSPRGHKQSTKHFHYLAIYSKWNRKRMTVCCKNGTLLAKMLLHRKSLNQLTFLI